MVVSTPDFDLCVNCKDGHPHPMEKHRFDLDGPSPVDTKSTQTDPQDFDLNVNCKDGHPHPMKKRRFDLDDGSSPVDTKSPQTDPQNFDFTSNFTGFNLIDGSSPVDAKQTYPQNFDFNSNFISFDLFDGSSSVDAKQTNPQDFDLCVCYKDGHPHLIEKRRFDLDGSSPVDTKSTQTYSQEARDSVIQRKILLLTHATWCRDSNCSFLRCQKMKQMIMRVINCKKRNDCLHFKLLFGICYFHAKQCKEAVCHLLFCSNLKHGINQLQPQHQYTIIYFHLQYASTDSNFEKFIHLLAHAAQCNLCPLSKCYKMKRVMNHTSNCKRKRKGESCSLCEHMYVICVRHARQCQEAECPILFCSFIKPLINKHQLQQSLQQASITD